MAGSRSTNRETDAIKANIAALWGRGQSAAKIAPQVNKSVRQVRRYLEALRDEWVDTIADHNTIRMQQLAELTEVKLEAWEAWEKSKQEQKTTTVESKGPPVGEGNVRAKGRAQQLSRIAVTTPVGEAKYLQLLLDAIDAQNKLLGLVVIKHAETDSRGNDRPQLSDDERAAKLIAILDAARERRTRTTAVDDNGQAIVVSESGATSGSPEQSSG